MSGAQYACPLEMDGAATALAIGATVIACIGTVALAGGFGGGDPAFPGTYAPTPEPSRPAAPTATTQQPEDLAPQQPAVQQTPPRQDEQIVPINQPKPFSYISLCAMLAAQGSTQLWVPSTSLLMNAVPLTRDKQVIDPAVFWAIVYIPLGAAPAALLARPRTRGASVTRRGAWTLVTWNGQPVAASLSTKDYENARAVGAELLSGVPVVPMPDMDDMPGFDAGKYHELKEEFLARSDMFPAAAAFCKLWATYAYTGVFDGAAKGDTAFECPEGYCERALLEHPKVRKGSISYADIPHILKGIWSASPDELRLCRVSSATLTAEQAAGGHPFTFEQDMPVSCMFGDYRAAVEKYLKRSGAMAPIPGDFVFVITVPPNTPFVAVQRHSAQMEDYDRGETLLPPNTRFTVTGVSLRLAVDDPVARRKVPHVFCRVVSAQVGL